MPSRGEVLGGKREHERPLAYLLDLFRRKGCRREYRAERELQQDTEDPGRNRRLQHGLASADRLSTGSVVQPGTGRKGNRCASK